MHKTLIYIGVPGAAVFESQVINFLKEIKRKEYFDRVVLLAGIKKEKLNDWDSEMSTLKDHDLEVYGFKRYPNYFFFERKQIAELEKVLLNILTENTVIHLRGEAMSRLVYQIIKKQGFQRVEILTDIRGASYEEASIYNNVTSFALPLKQYQLKKNIKNLNTSSDYLSCVSEKLKEYVLKRSSVNPNRIYVNNCSASNEFRFDNEIRNLYRKKLKIEDEEVLFLFVTGGIAKWQNTQMIINAIVDKGFKVLNLSKVKIDIPNVINLFVPHTEVANYLNAADLSIIWRNDDEVNKVASPVKFSEYVCCGLPVIANKGVDLINRYLTETGYGISIDTINEINESEINKLLLLKREEISVYARDRYSSKKITENYLSIYKKILIS